MFADLPGLVKSKTLNFPPKNYSLISPNELVDCIYKWSSKELPVAGVDWVQIKAQKNKDLRVVHFSLDLCKELSTLVVKIGPVLKIQNNNTESSRGFTL